MVPAFRGGYDEITTWYFSVFLRSPEFHRVPFLLFFDLFDDFIILNYLSCFSFSGSPKPNLEKGESTKR